MAKRNFLDKEIEGNGGEYRWGLVRKDKRLSDVGHCFEVFLAWISRQDYANASDFNIKREDVKTHQK